MWLRYWPYDSIQNKEVSDGIMLRFVETWTDAQGRVRRKEDIWVDDGAVRHSELEGDWYDIERLSTWGRHRWWLEGVTLQKRRRREP